MKDTDQAKLALNIRRFSVRPPGYTSANRISRIITACKRCRHKRIKCDKQLPRCSNCVKNGSDCLSVEAGTGETVCRSSIHELQEEVEQLKKENQKLKHKLAGSNESMLWSGGRFLGLAADDEQAVDFPDAEFVDECIDLFFLKINVQIPILERESFYEAEEDQQRFFLYMILAISTSLDQEKYSLEISAGYKASALKYVDWYGTGETDRLEQLQALLLLSQYSMMRPSSPGAWFLVGASIRLCMDMGLYSNLHGPLAEAKTRLFWCCFCLDRQISFYCGRPLGIDASRINVGLPSLVQLQSLSRFEQKESVISLHFIKLRTLQGDIYSYIHHKETRHNSLEDIRAWKETKTAELAQWLARSPPCSQFISQIFELNYHQTKIQLHGISPITPAILSVRDYQTLYASGSAIIQTYSSIDGMNYSWIAINNLFLGASAYLYLVYNCRAIRTMVDLAVLQHHCEEVAEILHTLSTVCYEQATVCERKFDILRINTVELLEVESSDSDGTNSTSEDPKDHTYGADIDVIDHFWFDYEIDIGRPTPM